jgi:WD40 repeat protein
VGLAFSPDGRRLATAGEWRGSPATDIRLWDGHLGRQQLILESSKKVGELFPEFGRDRVVGQDDDDAQRSFGHFSHVAFSPDGTKVATTDVNGTIRLMDSQRGNRIFSLSGHIAPVYHAVFSSDGQRLATAGENGVRLWDARTGLELLALPVGVGPGDGFAFSPDGHSIVTASHDGPGQATLTLWDADSGAKRKVLKPGTAIASVAFSPDSARFATAGRNDTVRLRDAKTGEEVLVLESRGQRIVRVVFSPDGNQIAAGGEIWNAHTGALLHSLDQAPKETTSRLAFSPEGDRVAGRSEQGTLTVWDARSGAIRVAFQAGGDRDLSLAFSPDGGSIAAAREDGTVRLWDGTTGAELAVLRGHIGPVSSVGFDPTGTRVVSAGWRDCTVRIWDITTRTAHLCFPRNAGRIHALAFSPNGQWFATAGADHTIRLTDTSTARPGLVFTGHQTPVFSIAFSPDGRLLASGGSSAPGTKQPSGTEVRVWDAANGANLLSLEGHTGAVLGIAFSPDGKRLATASADRTVRLWDVGSGALVGTLQGHGGAVWGVGFSHDGRRLASVSRDASLRLWDVASGAELLTLEGSNGGLFSVAFSPDGNRIMTGGTATSPKGSGWFEGEIRMWNVWTGGVVEEPAAREPEDHTVQLAWHFRRARETENTHDWFAVAFHLDPLIQAQPEVADFYRRRGDARAELGRWREALADFTAAVERQPQDFGSLHRLAWAALAVGDGDRYRQTCQRMVRQAGDKPTHSQAQSIALTAVLGRDAGVDPTLLMDFAWHFRVPKDADVEEVEVEGAAAYRAGRYDLTRDYLESIFGDRFHPPSDSVWGKLFIALAEERLGHHDEALRWLNKAAAGREENQAYRQAGLLVGAPANGPLSAVASLGVPAVQLPNSDDNWEQRLTGNSA